MLLLDEVFAVGDEEFQRKCFGKIAEFKRRGGTIVFVSHDAQAVERLCDRAVLLKQGEIAFDGRRARRSPRYRELLSADAQPGRALGRAARVGQRRGAGRLGARCSTPTATSGGSSPPASRSWSSCGSSREPTVRRPAGLARAARRRRHRARRRRRRHRRARLGGARRRARAAVRGRPAAARRGALPPSLRAARRRRRPPAALARRRGAVLRLPTGAETGAVLLAGRWSMQEIGASAPIGASDELAAPAPTGRS